MNTSFLKRLGYYLGGFSAGLIILSFILSGKKTSCNYGPNARVINDLIQKEIHINSSLQKQYPFLKDSVLREQLKKASVNFSKSDTQRDSCRLYYLENQSKKKIWVVENCKKTVQLIDYKAAE